jgi:LPXTG-site transpeptidase (sortase) family protein
MVGRPGRRVLLIAAAATLVLVSCIWVGGLALRAHEAQTHLTAARAALTRGVAAGVLSGGPSAAANPEAPADALHEVGTACGETAQAHSLLSEVSGQLDSVKPLMDGVEALPGVGARARNESGTLEVGSQLAAAGASLCQAMQPLLDAASGSDGPPSTSDTSARAALKAVLAARPSLLDAADKLEASSAALNNIVTDQLDSSSAESVQALRERLPSAVDSLRESAALLDMLGASGEKHFLLISQNPDELRATGGYIGSAGVIALGDGTARLLEYGSSRIYDTSPDLRVDTPAPFDTYLGPYWEFAGANWLASFPDVARQLAYFYGLARPDSHLDGVIALDQAGLERLLEVVGPVDVPDYGEQVSADQVQAALDRHVHAGDGNDEIGRKQFTAALSTAVLQRVLTAPRGDVPRLVEAVRGLLDEQHLIVSAFDPGTSEVLARHHWDGSILPADQDALMVVDSQITPSKQSQAIDRNVAYHVDLSDPASPHAEVDVTYVNHSEPVANVTYIPDYRTFVRIYAAAGAQLTGAQGLSADPTTSQECGRAVFGGEVLIPQGSTVRVSFSYLLPTSVVGGAGYGLLLQQQPGVPHGDASVLVNTTAGQTSAAMASAPGHNARWQLAQTSGSVLQTVSLPDAVAGGCGEPLVSALPLAPPTFLNIPSARITAPIVDIGVQADGTMDAPPTPDVVGWYRTSARAGDPGNLVLAGHVDWGTNTAVFWGLRDLSPSDPIIVRGADNVDHEYRVEWNRVFSRTDSTAIQYVAGSNDSILTLITCDGVYDRTLHDYSDRRIVRAILSDDR